MTINQLHYFISVGEYKSFTLAANKHYITQTAITLQIKQLEEELNIILIDRKKRPIELTPAGEIFFKEAKEILSRLNIAIQKTKDASKGSIGTIRIGYEKGYEKSKLSDVLRQFHIDHPNILFTCFRDDSDVLSQQLLNGDLDIVFAWDSIDLRNNDAIQCTIIDSAPLVVAAYNTHPFSTHKSLKREDLRYETLINMAISKNGNSIGDNFFKEVYRQTGFQPKILFSSSDVETILLMVSAHEGISIIPSFYVSKLRETDDLVFIPLEGENECEDMYQMYKKDNENLALQLLIPYFNKIK